MLPELSPHYPGQQTLSPHPKSESVHFSALLLRWKYAVPLHRINKFFGTDYGINTIWQFFDNIFTLCIFNASMTSSRVASFFFTHAHVVIDGHFQKVCCPGTQTIRYPSAFSAQYPLHPRRRFLCCPLSHQKTAQSDAQSLSFHHRMVRQTQPAHRHEFQD